MACQRLICIPSNNMVIVARYSVGMLLLVVWSVTRLVIILMGYNLIQTRIPAWEFNVCTTISWQPLTCEEGRGTP